MTTKEFYLIVRKLLQGENEWSDLAEEIHCLAEQVVLENE